jgi:hypothetical protein
MIIAGMVNTAISWTIKKYLRSLILSTPREVTGFVSAEILPPAINIPARLRIVDRTPPTPKIINNDTKN